MTLKRPFFILTIVGLLLLIIFALVQSSPEANWNFMDYILAGTLFFFTLLGIDLARLHIKRVPVQISIIVFIVLTLAFIWAELAVGLIS